MNVNERTAVDLMVRMHPLTTILNWISFWAFAYIAISTLMRGTFISKGIWLLAFLLLTRVILFFLLRLWVRRRFHQALKEEISE